MGGDTTRSTMATLQRGAKGPEYLCRVRELLSFRDGLRLAARASRRGHQKTRAFLDSVQTSHLGVIGASTLSFIPDG